MVSRSFSWRLIHVSREICCDPFLIDYMETNLDWYSGFVARNIFLKWLGNLKGSSNFLEFLFDHDSFISMFSCPTKTCALLSNLLTLITYVVLMHVILSLFFNFIGSFIILQVYWKSALNFVVYLHLISMPVSEYVSTCVSNLSYNDCYSSKQHILLAKEKNETFLESEIFNCDMFSFPVSIASFYPGKHKFM